MLSSLDRLSPSSVLYAKSDLLHCFGQILFSWDQASLVSANKIVFGSNNHLIEESFSLTRIKGGQWPRALWWLTVHTGDRWWWAITPWSQLGRSVSFRTYQTCVWVVTGTWMSSRVHRSNVKKRSISFNTIPNRITVCSNLVLTSEKLLLWIKNTFHEIIYGTRSTIKNRTVFRNRPTDSNLDTLFWWCLALQSKTVYCTAAHQLHLMMKLKLDHKINRKPVVQKHRFG